MILDGGSVFDFLSTDSGKLPANRRLAPDSRLTQHCVKASKGTSRCVSGPQQLSFVFTKVDGDARYVFWVLASFQSQLLRKFLFETKIKREPPEANRRLRGQETPDQKQRRRNRQKGNVTAAVMSSLTG